MRTKALKAGRLVVCIAALGVMMCANPTDQDTVRWRWSAQIPIANRDFVVGKEMQEGFRTEKTDVFIFNCRDTVVVDSINAALDTIQICDTVVDTLVTRIVNVDSTYYGSDPVLRADTVSGDVVAISVPDREIQDFEIEQDTLKDKRFHVILGPMALTSGLTISQDVPYTSGAFNSGVLPVALPGVYYLGFNATSPGMTVTLNNRSATTLANVIISIQGGGSSSPVNIGPNTVATTTLPVAGASVGSTVNVVISCTATGNGTLGVSFGLAGLVVDTVRAVDSLVQFTRSYINDYDLTDTMDIDFLDLEDGYFTYSMENHSGLFLNVKGIHHDMWKTAYCALINRQFEDISDLAAASPPADSGYFEGILMQSYSSVAPHTDQVFLAKNIAKDRIFPQWDSVQQRSETYVEYLVQSPVPTGQILSFSAGDSIVFWIRSSFIWGEKIRGKLAIRYERTSDPVSVAVDYPSFIKDAVDSLRGKLVFDSVPATISITTRMPGSAYLDTVYLDYSLWNPANPAVVTMGHDTLIKAHNNSVYRIPIDLTDQINQLPDSLNGSFHATIPVGSEALIVSDAMPSVADALGRMTVKVDAHYQINIGLGYQVTSQATVPMGTDVVDLGGYTTLSKLEEPSASLNLDLANHTNVNVRLLCLMAPEELAAGLDERSGDYITAQLAEPAGITSGGYINLFGPGGVVIPQRGSVKQNRIVLTETQMDALFKARDSGRVFIDCDTSGKCDTTRNLERYESKAAMHWRMQLPQMNMDALHDTDFVRVNASFYLEGIANTDSLFSDW